MNFPPMKFYSVLAVFLLVSPILIPCLAIIAIFYLVYKFYDRTLAFVEKAVKGSKKKAKTKEKVKDAVRVNIRDFYLRNDEKG